MTNNDAKAHRLFGGVKYSAQKNGGHCLAAPPFRIEPGRELADQFVIREEELNLFRCRFSCVRAVH